MKLYFAASTGGFYDDTIHGDQIPEDAIEIALTEYQALMSGQALGKRIVADASGNPVLVDPLPPTDEQIQSVLDAAVTAWIDGQARASGFKDAAYLVSYYDSTNVTWKAIARAFVPWRDGIWTYCIGVVDAVRAGTRPVPTAEQLIAELPAFQVTP